MKRIFIFCAAICMLVANPLRADNNSKLSNNSNNNTSNIQMGDWRQGIYNRDVSEHLAIVNVEAIPVITKAFKETTPWAFGFIAGYEYKMRPSVIHNKFSFGLGLHLGVTRYFGKDINATATGSETDKKWDSYKSYTEIPLMVDFNMYYNFKRSNIFVGISGGINFMLGQRDARVDTIGNTVTQELEDAYNLAYASDITVISIQKDENNVSLNHVIPTFRFNVGYMYELTPNVRLRAIAGLEYQFKYFDEYKGFRLGTNYYEYYHQHDSPAMLNPYISIGAVYSL